MEEVGKDTVNQTVFLERDGWMRERREANQWEKWWQHYCIGCLGFDPPLFRPDIGLQSERDTCKIYGLIPITECP